jgi:hypothetical protein
VPEEAFEKSQKCPECVRLRRRSSEEDRKVQHPSWQTASEREGLSADLHAQLVALDPRNMMAATRHRVFGLSAVAMAAGVSACVDMKGDNPSLEA